MVDDQVAGCKNRHRRVPEALTLERLLQDNPVVCSTVVARREALQQAGGFDEDPDLVATEDYDLWLRLARQQPIAYLPEPLSYYRVHRGSLSANARFLRGVDRIMDKLGRSCGGDPRFGRLRARRRARARLDVAWDLLVAGQGAECRRLLREAVGLAGWSLPALRMWARSLLPFPAR